MNQRLGNALFGLAAIGFGVVSFVRRDDVAPLEPLPAWLPGRIAVAMIVAVVLVAAGGSLLANWRVSRAAGALGVVLSVWLVALHWPKVVMHPKDGGAWVVLWEVAAMGAVAWMIARPVAALRIAYGLSFVAFGISHFVYHGYVESVIPAWIPAHVFFAYATGVAHIAAGCSILSRVQDRLATLLLAVMFGSWVVVVHFPRVLASTGNMNEWTSLFVALAMCGGALVAHRVLAKSA